MSQARISGENSDLQVSRCIQKSWLLHRFQYLWVFPHTCLVCLRPPSTTRLHQLQTLENLTQCCFFWIEQIGLEINNLEQNTDGYI